jgi:hypothetical protein
MQKPTLSKAVMMMVDDDGSQLTTTRATKRIMTQNQNYSLEDFFKTTPETSSKKNTLTFCSPISAVCKLQVSH